MKLLRAAQFLAAVMMMLFIGAAVFTSTQVAKRQQQIEKASRHDGARLAARANVELSRLIQTVSTYGIAGSGTSLDDVRRQLDTVRSQLEAMKSGTFDVFVQADSERQEVVEDFAGATDLVSEKLVKASDLAGSLEVIGRLRPIEERLGWLTEAANKADAAAIAADQKELVALHWSFAALIVGLIACGVIMMVSMVVDFRTLKKTNTNLQIVANSLEKTKLELEAANRGINTANAELNLHNQILKMHDKEMRTQNVRFDAALNNMSHGLCMAGADDKLIVCNDQFRDLFNIDPETARPGTAIPAILVRMGVSMKLGEAGTMDFIREHDLMVSAKKPEAFTRDCPDGRSFAIYHQPMVDGGWVSTFEDITERRKQEEKISHMAHHDALTGLPNRVYFLQHLESALVRARRGESNCSVLCLDLDRFKAVNDTLGHPVGDLLLKQVATRLQASVEPGDVVARFGGDEFAILKNSHVSPEALAHLGSALVRSISSPFELEGNEVSIGTSVGIALGFKDGTSSEQLLKNADLALYHSKSEGRGAYHFFEPHMDAKMQARRLIENDLRNAIPNNELLLFYQPLVNVLSRRITGFESLVRWRHAEKGMISPADFIPISEEVGLIIPIGEWVLNVACRTAMNWDSNIKVAVNLSPVQFRDKNIVQTVKNALASSGLPPHRLDLEITETALVQDMEFTVSVLHQLRSMGVLVSLDDFGTGYSSLSYLRAFPFDKIKIDQSFVRDLSSRPDCLAIVKSVTSLGDNLGMSTLAEGVETEDNLAILRDLGCKEAQGYLFSRPVPETDALALIQRFNHSAASRAA